jgi:hypothetical protein
MLRAYAKARAGTKPAKANQVDPAPKAKAKPKAKKR